jgi:hypothetical protein
MIMKKTFFVFAALTVAAFTTVTNASTVKCRNAAAIRASVNAAPPAAVQAAFNANFGNTPVQQWKLRSNGNWRAHFMLNGVAWEATFTAAGVLVKSERA